MSVQFYHLEQFLGCYFHQDWDLEAKTGAEILCRYVASASDDERSAITEEITELLRSPDSIVDETVGRFGCYYDPSVDGLSNRQWLAKIGTTLRSTNMSSKVYRR